MSLLEIRDLCIHYPGADRPAVDGLSFALAAGESVGLVGESGSGKTQTALAVLGLLPDQARVSGRMRFDGKDLAGPGAHASLRARRIGMVFQDPLAALNPYLTVAEQLGLVLRRHRLATRREARQRVIDMLERIGLPDPPRQARAYPRELSGGMRQRVMIAAALAAGPDLLIADEPTTALDVTVQAQILTLLRDLRRDTGIALLLITHDLGIVAGNCERLVVVDRGRMLETGTTKDVFARPGHARSAELLRAARDDAQKAPDMMSSERRPLLGIHGVGVRYSESGRGAIWGRRQLAAVRDLSVRLRPGETLGIVGESGSGKTSLARAVLGLVQEMSGSVSFLGRTLPARLEDRDKGLRRHLQLVFQNPGSSLNPAMTAYDCVAEPLKVHAPELAGAEQRARVMRMLERVGLDPGLEARYPHELSGGQAQRVAIARALIANPSVLICDEAVASLDATVRQGILRLLADEQRRTALAILFISHDLHVVRQFSHRVLVMYMGRLVELAETSSLFERPQHPYTRALIDSIPVVDPDVAPADASIEGEAPRMPGDLPGCAFEPRCRYAVDRCSAERPELSAGAGNRVACHRAGELELGARR
ncbi:MAG: ABC transporter ATP-binding protein [Gammaproteobacteria bacterium]|nr:ABC transporter ATP-binding protein [Gammaproteobacteria bacterium]MDH4255062.1 ABC transporter ATP-binding protein [Gammaproteobacteria bacterium]MDH5309556.1 ABC transporter ATP-binding protein [Gammaproteobacteria bacterium]